MNIKFKFSERVEEILREAEEIAGGSRSASPSRTGRSLSDSALSRLLRESGVQEVPLGFRSSFRDRCADAGRAGEIAVASSAHIVRGVEGACFPRDGFGAPTRLDRGTGRLHRRVRTNLTARTMAAARAATVDGNCKFRTVPEPSARTKRPFVAKLRRSRRRFRPISRRNRNHSRIRAVRGGGANIARAVRPAVDSTGPMRRDRSSRSAPFDNRRRRKRAAPTPARRGWRRRA